MQMTSLISQFINTQKGLIMYLASPSSFFSSFFPLPIFSCIFFFPLSYINTFLFLIFFLCFSSHVSSLIFLFINFFLALSYYILFYLPFSSSFFLSLSSVYCVIFLFLSPPIYVILSWFSYLL